MPASLHYGLTLNEPRGPSGMPRIRWVRRRPHHLAVRWAG
jgi:hypothetical protein